jgi:uncharacterized 2Fe-2S/4Fe-4S cluster protein (DUF4445 family)
VVKVVIEPYNITVEVAKGVRAYDVLRTTGIPFRTECGGRGLCGKCRVVIKSGEVSQLSSTEKRLLSVEEIKAGYRLACQVVLQGDVRLFVPPETRSKGIEAAIQGLTRDVLFSPLAKKIYLRVEPPSLEKPHPDVNSLLKALGSSELTVEFNVLKELSARLRRSNWAVTVTLWRGNKVIGLEEGDTSRENLGIAVDIGTTKIVLHLVDLANKKTLAMLSTENPQIVYGDDIISRIHAAVLDAKNLEDMKHLVVRAVNNLVRVALVTAGIEKEHLTSAVIVGNTVMHHVFLGLDVSGLGASPYVPVTSDPLELPGYQLGLESVAYVYFPPIIAGYVGGDALADIIATGMHLKNRPILLIDIGTNTEIILNTGEKLLACSTPSGPAFEGGHIKHGMKAVPGAIRRVVIRDSENVEYEVIGGEKPLGVAGSALIDVVAGLLENGLLSWRGLFNKGIHSSRLLNLPNSNGYEFVIVRAEDSATGRDITISEKDIAEIRLAKAAIYSGIMVLLERAHLDPKDIEEVLIAGSFGYNLDIGNAVRIGLLPNFDLSKVRLTGNTAIEGAKLMLISEQAVQEAEKVARETEYIELTVAQEFKKIFPRALTFPRESNEG